jgi:geranylgeranyl diphosphate synthase type II
MRDFNEYLSKKAKEIEASLKREISLIKNAPQIITDAMSYSLNADGKRIRPALLNMTAEAFGLKRTDSMPAACALEMLHTYSLIHDDLPVMDNDDLRRGKPTNHKVFGEDLALLAGDALLTYAFEILSRLPANKNIKPANALKAANIIASCAGASGMIGGQTADIFAEGILEGKSKRAAKLSLRGKRPVYYLLPKETKEVCAAALLDYIHKNKTGALISAAVLSGAALAGANEKDFNNMKRYSRAIGFAFQVVDDILDATASVKRLGKSASDAKNKKLTYVSLYGLEESKKAARKACESAVKVLDAIKTVNKSRLEYLHDLARFIIKRSY